MQFKDIQKGKTYYLPQSHKQKRGAEPARVEWLRVFVLELHEGAEVTASIGGAPPVRYGRNKYRQWEKEKPVVGEKHSQKF
jgi:hypothetical protein